MINQKGDEDFKLDIRLKKNEPVKTKIVKLYAQIKYYCTTTEHEGSTKKI